MALDNLFSTLGGPATAMILFSILAFVGAPAVGSVACPANAFRRLQPRGR